MFKRVIPIILIILLIGCGSAEKAAEAPASNEPAVENAVKEEPVDDLVSNEFNTINVGDYTADIPSSWINSESYYYMKEKGKTPYMQISFQDGKQMDDLLLFKDSLIEGVLGGLKNGELTSDFTAVEYEKASGYTFSVKGGLEGMDGTYFITVTIFENPSGGLVFFNMMDTGNDNLPQYTAVLNTVQTNVPFTTEEKKSGSESNNTVSSQSNVQTEEKEAVPEKVMDYSVKQEFFNDYVDSIGNHVGSAFAEIVNTGNTPLYLNDAQFDIEDNDGHLLTTATMVSSCPDAIYPGESGYFYTDYIDLSGVDDSNGLKFAPHYKIEEARNKIIDYEVSDLGIREDDVWKCKVSGRLTNTQDEKIGILYLNVVYYDANGNVLGISGTNITDVQPGDTVSFEITGQFFYDNVNYSDIAEYRVYPRAWYMQF